MFTMAKDMAKAVMDSKMYELWNYNENPLMENWSNCYLFNLEDAGSNPAGLDKSSNKEYILYRGFGYTPLVEHLINKYNHIPCSLGE